MNAAELTGRIRAHRPGHALAREFYTDAAIFEHDLHDMLLRHWLCAGHVSSIAHAGDYCLVDLGPESAIVVRTSGGEVRALLNVCRHRGSRLCSERTGRLTGRLTCPYHAWSYDLEGRLLAARHMPESFDRSAHGLRSLPVRVMNGLVFISFAENPLELDTAADALARSAAVHGWAEAKVAHRELYSVRANWKLAIENYMECYHCSPAHPEFARRHVIARLAQQAQHLEADGRQRAAAIGIAIPDIDRYAAASGPGRESVSVWRSSMEGGHTSGTEDGRLVSKLMGRFQESDGNTTYMDIGPLSDFLAYPDHGVIYRFIPRSVDRTELEVIWLVHQDAVEGVDYDVSKLTWLWRVTSEEDKKIVEMNQEGVNSQFYRAGPYSLQESYASRFVEWYLSELAP
jgi:phenylpropionate dioxygenase-like ring-hydroxylating dioxygenase large terminal subunit